MKRILILHTGGTITMQLHGSQRDSSRTAISFNLDFFDEQVPGLQEIAGLESRTLFLEDSSNMLPELWVRLAEAIEADYGNFDGFVVLHGTDTMAYTASALSFAFENLSKPVVFTGSQVPLSNRRTDARRNLINSVELATLNLPEVCICFNDRVYRGNRATKISIGDFDAFASPNHPVLAEFGLNLDIRSQYRPDPGAFRNRARFDPRVQLVKLFPGMDFSRAIPGDASDVRAMVIEAYGSGNLPAGSSHTLIPALGKYIGSGGIVIITSQAVYDEVDLDKYEGGRQAKKLGAISAGDMTTEACITKIMYLLAHYDDNITIRDLFRENLAGERTH
jgi:L-asparaginase